MLKCAYRCNRHSDTLSCAMRLRPESADFRSPQPGHVRRSRGRGGGGGAKLMTHVTVLAAGPVSRGATWRYVTVRNFGKQAPPHHLVLILDRRLFNADASAREGESKRKPIGHVRRF